MKKFYSSLILLFFLKLSAIAQLKSNYERGFEIGFKEGYCYNRSTLDCFTPMTPLSPIPRINENRESYTDGYNRGFQYGLDLKRNNDALRNSDNSLKQKVISFNKYTPQNPVEAMRVVGMIKQQKYDARTEWLQEKVYQFRDLYNYLFNSENFPIGFDTLIHKNNLRNVFLEYLDNIKGYDFSDDFVFNSIQVELNNIENYYYEYYNSIITQIKQRTEKETRNVSDSSKSKRQKQIKNIKFSKILEKNSGKYSCTINVYKLVNNNYTLEQTKSGFLELIDNFIAFGTDYLDTERELLSESLDDDAKEYTYETEEGNVVIDYNFKKVIFFDLDNKNYYVYTIKNKI